MYLLTGSRNCECQHFQMFVKCKRHDSCFAYRMFPGFANQKIMLYRHFLNELFLISVEEEKVYVSLIWYGNCACCISTSSAYHFKSMHTVYG